MTLFPKSVVSYQGSGLQHKFKSIYNSALFWLRGPLVLWPELYGENLMAKVMVLGVGAFGSRVGHGAGVLTHGLSPLTRHRRAS